MPLYRARVFKSLSWFPGVGEWYNEYIVTLPDHTDAGAHEAAAISLAQGERWLSHHYVKFQRIDCQKIDEGGMSQGPEAFYTTYFLADGCRWYPPAYLLPEKDIPLRIKKTVNKGRAGALLLRHCLTDVEVKADPDGTLRFTDTNGAFMVSWEYFLGRMASEGVQQWIVNYYNDGITWKDKQPMQEWLIGAPMPTESIEDAQLRKRPAGQAAEASTMAAIGMGCRGVSILRAAYIAAGDCMNPDSISMAVGMVSDMAKAGEQIEKYFKDFEAPFDKQPRWVKPQADPQRPQAKEAATAWKDAAKEFKKTLENVEPCAENPDEIKSSWVDKVRKQGEAIAAIAHGVLVSRFT